MTIDEAIKHAEKVMIENLEKTKDRNASDPIATYCLECAEELRQLAEWLTELKKLREQTEPEKCGDCISRQAVNKLVDELARAISDEKCHIQRGRNYGRIMHDILDLPSVEPERKTGEWIYGTDDETGKIDLYAWTCSECYEKYPWKPKFCPNCGAKMEVNDDNSNDF